MAKYFTLLFLIPLKFVFSISYCLKGENNCTKCNYITKLCVKCSLDIFVPDKKGGCEPSKKCELGKNYCNLCSDNLEECEICETGYFPDNNGGCSYTDNCELSYKGECLKCKDNFILIGKKKSELNNNLILCKSLMSIDLKNCEEINLNNGICSKCKKGYYLNKGDNRCIETENCYESSFGVCTKCIRGYYFLKKENKCLKQELSFAHCQETINGISCDKCDDNYYLSEDGKCSQNNFCSKVGDLNQCLECISGYFKSEYNSICSSTENCYLADTETGLCYSCLKNYCLDQKDGKCKSNQEDNDLKYCRTADEYCFDCPYPYFLGEDLKCTPSRYCAISENGVCNLCSDNYYLGLDNKCIDVENCIYSNEYFRCSQCKDKYYYVVNEKKCLLEKEGFINCLSTDYFGKNCGKCREGFYLNKKDYKCYSNKEFGNFYNCEESDISGEFCDSCIKDYYFGKKYKRCWKIEGCEMSLDDIRCEECDEFHVLNMKSGKCEVNNKIIDENKKYYYKCNRTNELGTACEICANNYILNENGLCEDSLHCVEKNNGICTKCQKNENENFNYCLNEILGCAETDLDNCLECNDILDLNKCSKCLDGYELNNQNKCIKKEEGK